MSKPSKRSASGKVTVARADDGAWELKHPRCARARQEDIEEVVQMIAAGELEIARDELRWLLADCHDFILAHKLLGDLAVAENDLKLARGHYGYAYQLGLKAIDGGSPIDVLPCSRSANRPFYEAGKGLIECLTKLRKQGMASEAVKRLLQLDPADSLGLKSHNGPRGKN